MIEGILCNLYKKYLSKGDYNEFVIQLTSILNKKEIPFEIKKGGALRSYVRDFIVQVVINNKKYVLVNNASILESTDEICSKYIEYLFYSKGKFLPRSIVNGDIEDIYKEYKKNKKYNHYYNLLEKYYGVNEIAIIFERGIKKNKLFEEYYDIIDNSIKLYLIEEYNGAITILLPCIEGMLRKILNNKLGIEGYSNDSNYLKSILDKVLMEWQNIIYPEKEYWFLPEFQNNFKNLYLTEGLSVMIRGFLFFLSDFIYEKIEKFKEKYPEETLNRHSILHGFTQNYGTKHNWLYIFGMLDFLLILSSFKVFKDGHNIHSLIKRLEYIYIKEQQDVKRKCKFEDELKYLNHIFNKIIMLSLQEANKEVEESQFRKRYIKEIIQEKLENNLRKNLSIISYYYSWEYDYELEKTLKLKYTGSSAKEKNLVNIYFEKTGIEIKESYINYYLDLEKYHLEEIKCQN